MTNHATSSPGASSDQQRRSGSWLLRAAIYCLVAATALLVIAARPLEVSLSDGRATPSRAEVQTLTREEFLSLLDQGKAQILRVNISSTADLPAIRRTGVLVMTAEPSYVVIVGDGLRVQALRGLKFHVRDPIESDHKQRRIEVWAKDEEAAKRIAAIVSDVWPAGGTPGLVKGQALDIEIQWLRDEGFDVKRVE